jgi:NAD(P)-dependent dehydrogenase (short-subunit alcohol dehydrogenase family)
MKTALVTGANRGIGLETAKQLAELGYRVFLGCRYTTLGKQAVDQLHALGLIHTEVIQLDVTDSNSIKSARKQIEIKSGQLDVLVNNAAIMGELPQQALTVCVADIRKVFDTNFFGVIEVTQEFIPLLKKSNAGRIVNVSSDLSSLTLNDDPDWKYYPFKSTAYGISKTALNAFTIMLAYELRDTAIKVNAVNPGYTATDLNNNKGEKKPGEAAKVIVKYAILDKSGETGKFFSEEGKMPW